MAINNLYTDTINKALFADWTTVDQAGGNPFLAINFRPKYTPLRITRLSWGYFAIPADITILQTGSSYLAILRNFQASPTALTQFGRDRWPIDQECVYQDYINAGSGFYSNKPVDIILSPGTQYCVVMAFPFSSPVPTSTIEASLIVTGESVQPDGGKGISPRRF